MRLYTNPNPLKGLPLKEKSEALRNLEFPD
jgi:hypothetical protein